MNRSRTLILTLIVALLAGVLVALFATSVTPVADDGALDVPVVAAFVAALTVLVGALATLLALGLHARWPALAGVIALFGLAVAFPGVMLVRLMLQSQRFEADPGAWLAATGNTVQAAGIGAIVALALALPIGVLAARHSDRVTKSIESAAFISHALPGVVVGLSLVYLGLSIAPALYQTLAMLGFAYAVLFLSNAIGSIRSATAQVSRNLEDVARTLGDRPTTTWWRVTARLSAPGILAGALLVLVTAMKELPATLMLRPTGFETLATEMWTFTTVGSFSQAAPYAFGLVVLAAIPAFLLARLTGRRS